MIVKVLGLPLCVAVLCFGCDAFSPKYTFRLADRHIRFVGLNPTTGQMEMKPTYGSNEVYVVLAQLTGVAIKIPGNSSLSGRADYRLLVQTAPDASPFKEGDRFLVAGGADGTTAWATNGVIAEVVFLRTSNKFVDFRTLPKNN